VLLLFKQDFFSSIRLPVSYNSFHQCNLFPTNAKIHGCKGDECSTLADKFPKEHMIVSSVGRHSDAGLHYQLQFE